MKTKFYKLHNSSLTKHKVASQKELWEKLEAKGYKGLELQAKTVFTKSSKSENVFHAIFSTSTMDRHGEIVYQNWNLKNFKKNPVYLDSHNYGSIEHIIGKVSKMKQTENDLTGDIEFALSNPKGAMASEMAKDGFINASSVGFIPLEFDEKGNIIKSELLEISAVSVPANPEALYELKKYENTRKDTGDDNTENENISDSKTEREKDKEGEKEIADEVIEIKSSPVEVVSKAIRQEYDIKSRALGRILSAIKLVSQETKGRKTPSEEKADVNAKVNRAIKELLKLKN